MRRPVHFALTLALPMIFAACATTDRRQSLERVHSGMDKSQVLEVAGNPKRTARTGGLDHWTYVFFERERELTQQIDFRDGRVVKIGPPTAKRGLTEALENAESMEDYERAVKAHQKKAVGFEDVPGGTDEK